MDSIDNISIHLIDQTNHLNSSLLTFNSLLCRLWMYLETKDLCTTTKVGN